MHPVTTLTAELIDYAGLFPPAELGMREALENYSEYSDGADSASLGRFIVPGDRLDELEIAGRDLLPRGKGAKPWRISALVSGDMKPAIARVLKFNCEHWEGSAIGHAVIDAVEMKISSPAEIAPTRKEIPAAFEAYFEIPLDEDLGRSLSERKNAGARAKIRTGGVTAAAFPVTGQIVRFMRACCDGGVAFKATAGLHHPVRAPYRLTYEPDSASGVMFGFLNVFVASAFMWNGADDITVARILDETDAARFTFTHDAVVWREKNLSTNRLAEARRAFAISFGSCSFREPVDELKLLTSGAALT